jgi:hypothetical protein
MQAKATKNIRGKSHPQQRKMSSKATKGKKPVKESEANLKFILGKRMLTVDMLKQVGKFCVELHNDRVNNYNKNKA